MVSRNKFDINFNTVFPNRENWHNQLPPETDTWFTDGSKSGEGVVAGIYFSP